MGAPSCAPCCRSFRSKRLLKHLYRRADDQPQPKIIDVFISKLRKKLRMASGGAEVIETIPQRGWILRDLENGAA